MADAEPADPSPSDSQANGSQPAGSQPEARRATLRRLAVSLAVVVAIFAAIYYLDPSREQVEGATAISPGGSGAAPRVGMVAPDFQAAGLDGKPLRLADYRGRPVWLNFWASWCPPCRAETPDVEAAYRERRGDGLELLAVSIGEDAATVRRYVETSGVSFTVLLDPDQSVAGRYRISGIPTHFFLDKNGVIREMQVGGLNRSAILRRLGSIMPAS